jgi:hypothetical protein
MFLEPSFSTTASVYCLRSELRWRLVAPTFFVTWLERGNIHVLS